MMQTKVSKLRLDIQLLPSTTRPDTYPRVLSLDTLARLSVYTVPSSAPSYTALLPHFLPPRTSLPHTVVVIALDWTKPWTFIDELYTWLDWIEKWVQGDGSRELQIVREENRERCESEVTTECVSRMLTSSHRSAGTFTALYRAFRGPPSCNIHTLK